MLRHAARALALVVSVLAAPPGMAQTSAPPPAALSALFDQTVALFPTLEGEVVDVQGTDLTVALPRSSGARSGLVLEVFREGREIRHPRTGELLGRAEQRLGRAVIGQVFEGYSVAALEGAGGGPVTAGDRVRSPGGKLRLTLVILAGPGIKPGLVETLAGETYEGLTRTGRFQVVMGDQVGLWLAQERIVPEEFLQGRGVRQAAERFKVDDLLVLHVRVAHGKPLMDVRLFLAGRAEPALATASVVPPSIQPVSRERFSVGDGRGPAAPEPKPRSLLARLLGWGLDPDAYSSADSTIPLREVARFPFAVLSMDVAVAPADRLPRLVVTDGERIHVYKIANRRLEAEWTYEARSLGRVFSVQLAELTGDGILEVVASRFGSRVGMSSLVVGLRDGRPVALVDQVDAILYAVDDSGAGVKQTLWAQRYREESFFDKGQADQMALRGGALVTERRAVVPEAFRATGATFSNVMGKERRALVYVDEQNRLRVAAGTEEVWRSSSPVGGGGQKIEVFRWIERGGRSYFYQMEPVPLAADLDGDGIEEIVVPQNQAETGVLAVVFRGPAGLRLQLVNSGFEGVVLGLGAIPTEDGGSPALIAGVVRHKSVLRTSGDTQIIMAVQE
jgi:hypothetical protein